MLVHEVLTFFSFFHPPPPFPLFFRAVQKQTKNYLVQILPVFSSRSGESSQQWLDRGHTSGSRTCPSSQVPPPSHTPVGCFKQIKAKKKKIEKSFCYQSFKMQPDGHHWCVTAGVVSGFRKERKKGCWNVCSSPPLVCCPFKASSVYKKDPALINPNIL